MAPIDDGDRTVLPPDDAFAVLGNETRMSILRTLGAAEGPLAFSELRDRVGMRDSGQFNYHLEKLAGHFVSKTGDGYALRQAGQWVIETVLSGAVTEDPVVEPTPVDDPCPVCDGQTVVAFNQERLDHYCTACSGYYGDTTALTETVTDGDDAAESREYGYIGSVPFPPAGLEGRTPQAVFEAASAWFTLEVLAIASGVCPRCSARLSESVAVCEAHDATDGVCRECGHRHAVLLDAGCTNCLFEQRGALGLALTTDSDVLAFLLEHGINPVSQSPDATSYNALMDYDEELLSVDPFEARLTFDLDGDTLAVRVDDDLTVVDVSD